MPRYLDKLLSIAGSALSNTEPVLNDQISGLAGSLTNDLLNMLRIRNGFYALEGALHVFPSQSSQQEIGLDEWNDDTFWRNEYHGMANGCLFFAEDVFGGQFCIKNNKVYTFDPETAELTYLADDIEGWAEAIVGDFEVLTGYPIAHEWQLKHGKFPAKKRLLPKTPFVAGGEYAISNLYLNDAAEGMKFRAGIAKQIKDLPDGAQIKFNIVS